MNSNDRFDAILTAVIWFSSVLTLIVFLHLQEKPQRQTSAEVAPGVGAGSAEKSQGQEKQLTCQG